MCIPSSNEQNAMERYAQPEERVRRKRGKSLEEEKTYILIRKKDIEPIDNPKSNTQVQHTASVLVGCRYPTHGIDCTSKSMHEKNLASCISHLLGISFLYLSRDMVTSFLDTRSLDVVQRFPFPSPRGHSVSRDCEACWE